jgi:hypothetical protein
MSIEIISSEYFTVQKCEVLYKGENYQVEIITNTDDSTWIECNVMQDGEDVKEDLANEIYEALNKVID